MFRNLIVASVLFAGLAMNAVSADACDPKHDPGCDSPVAAAAPCDPKKDPGCESPVAAAAPCDPKTDPSCGN